MAGSRPVKPEDVERGERLAALRATRWPSINAFVKDTGIDRVRWSRAESGQDRFLSRDFQEQVAGAFGLQASRLLAYVHGEVSLSELTGGNASVRAVEREFEPPAEDEPPTDPTADGRWRRRAAVDPAFRRLATAKRGLARANGESLVLVETALDMAHDELPRNYGGLSYDEALAGYEDAWADLQSKPRRPRTPEPAPVEAPPPPINAETFEQRLARIKAEDEAKKRPRGAAKKKPPR